MTYRHLGRAYPTPTEAGDEMTLPPPSLTGASLRDRALATGEAATASSSLRDCDPSRAYAIAVTLKKDNGGSITIQTFLRLELARSEDEARGKVISIAMSEFPTYSVLLVVADQVRASAIEAPAGDETEGLGPKAESAVPIGQTPEALALWSLIQSDPFGDSPLKAISDALAAAERAAYERAAEVAGPEREYDLEREGDWTAGWYIGKKVAAKSILSLIDKETT
jgi:hypothetical protein